MIEVSKMKVSRISVKNFKSFEQLNLDGFQEFSVLIGQNGVGKSNLMSVFSFLSDCVTTGDINTAVERIGISRLCYNGNSTVPTEIAVTFRDDALNTAQYLLKIGYKQGKAILEDEQLIVSETVDGVVKNHHELHNKRGVCKLGDVTEQIKETDIALSIFGRLPKYKETVAVYNFLKGVRTVNFALTALRSDSSIDDMQLSHLGHNLKSVALEMQNVFPMQFESVVEHMECAMGITKILLQKLPTGNITLSFVQGTKTISEAEISDGTLSLFAYYVLLEHPLNSSILCIEEPERNISHTCLVQLAEVMRIKAKTENAQILVTSHSSEFISALKLNEVFYVSTTDSGTSVTALRGNMELKSHLKDIPLGELYTTGFIEAVL